MMTIHEFGRRLRGHELTAEEVTDSCVRRIETDHLRRVVRYRAPARLRCVQKKERLYGFR